MYGVFIRQCADMLENLAACFDKAVAFGAERNFDPDVLMYERLAPDMYPMFVQIESACQYAVSGAALLSGRTPPREAEQVRTIEGAVSRLTASAEFMKAADDDAFAAAPDRGVTLPWRPSAPISGQDYLVKVVVPNVFFHVSIAYAILRASGVDVGKLDYLGEIYRHER